ncbi:unnamed protein product [Cylindrotheca closterium]|uniref:Uncharacterized protein n=1 Tax=Cylindrotheca closterium TaxID=2856 RepID=A0AAD2CHW4_9STRA|nr:unnamed protein product [Cylindrotheca closterium]
MHTIIKKMKELKQLRAEEESSSSSCTDTDDCSSVENNTSSNQCHTKIDLKSRRKQIHSKRFRRRRASDNNNHAAGAASDAKVVQALRHEIATLKCKQDQMESYRINLERDHRCRQRQLVAMEFSKQMTEMKSRELEQEVRDVVEDQLRFDNQIRYHQDVVTKPKMEQYYTAEIGLLEIENRILQQKLERCQHKRHLSMLADLPPQM